MPEVISRPGSILGSLLDGANKLGRLELVRLLRSDQLRRWQQGDRLPVEVYLQEVPTLRADPELAIDLVFSEFLLRREVLNEAPSLEEYVERFPAYAEQLREQHMMEALWQEAAHTQGHGPHAPATGLAPPMDADGTIIDPAAESRAAQTGTPALPGYELLGELGRGGMGSGPERTRSPSGSRSGREAAARQPSGTRRSGAPLPQRGAHLWPAPASGNCADLRAGPAARWPAVLHHETRAGMHFGRFAQAERRRRARSAALAGHLRAGLPSRGLRAQ